LSCFELNAVCAHSRQLMLYVHKIQKYTDNVVFAHNTHLMGYVHRADSQSSMYIQSS